MDIDTFETRSEPAVTTTLRRIVFIILGITLVGTASELVLLAHWESPIQWIPLVGYSLGLITWAAVGVKTGHLTLRAFQVVMAGFVIAGAAGVFFHFRGNVAFARETYPDMTGLAFLKEVITGATPMLAPGTMAQLGLLGLAFTYRHPGLRAGANGPTLDKAAT